jgi:hypothetical protein
MTERQNISLKTPEQAHVLCLGLVAVSQTKERQAEARERDETGLQ